MMKLKYYLGFAIIFVLGISAYIYMVLPDNFTIATPTSEQVELPIAIWVAIALSLFFVMSLVFFFWDWIRVKIQSFYYQKDFSMLISQVINQATGKVSGNLEYKNEKFTVLSKILNRFVLIPKMGTQESGVEKVDKLFEVFEQINLGYEQDIKKYNLPYDNEYFIKNFMNKFKKDYRVGINAFKSPMPNAIKKDIFIQMLDFIEVKDLQRILDIEKIDVLDKDMGFAVVEFLQKKNSNVSDTYMAEIFKKSKFDSQDYIELAKRLKTFYTPDNLLRFFERLTVIDDKAEIGYLYVLCDLEMIDLARQKLASLPKDEFLNVRAYMDLRTQNRSYPLNIFF